MTQTLPPWLVRAGEQFDQALRDGRLTHAILLSAAPGWGVLNLAERVARSILEVSADYDLSHHLDYLNVALEERRTLISIDQIRDATDFLSTTSREGTNKLVLVNEADRLSIPASQALLKILEEPPADKYLLLVSTHSELLSPTIRSRCQRFVVQNGTQDEVVSFLAAQAGKDELNDLLDDYGGAPYAALAALTEKRSSLKSALTRLLRNETSLVDLAREMRDEEPDDLLRRWQYVTLRLAHNSATIDPVATFYEQLSDIRRQFREVPGLEKERQYIRLLIKWRNLLRGHQRRQR